MFLFITPDIDNVSTQVVQKTEYIDFSASSIFDGSTSIKKDATMDLISFFDCTNSTQVIDKNDELLNHGTWIELLNENLDVVSKFVFPKSFKVKSKVKSVSRFFPEIVID